ncbi:hypothetical protein M0R72_11565 [Candidatus Pacearchaeota archaeon]|nr:hypothetical protein [Candidatus Pacearchaeota archaeon]
MRVKKKLLARHIKNGYALEETNGQLHLTRNGEHVAWFAVYATAYMVRRAIEDHIKEKNER